MQSVLLLCEDYQCCRVVKCTPQDLINNVIEWTSTVKQNIPELGDQIEKQEEALL